MRNTHRRGGFTLVELTMVMVVLGTLSAVALPKLADLSRDARVVKIDTARSAVLESAHIFHLKWMLAGSPAVTTVIDGVEMNGAGYPTDDGIIVASGVAASYDTHLAGTIATDRDHPDCSLAYAPDTGTATMYYANGSNC